MRSLSFSILLGCIFSYKSFAQIADTSGQGYTHKHNWPKECKTTREGRTGMIYGGIATGVGGAILLYDDHLFKTEPKYQNGRYPPASEYFALILVILGLPNFVTGGIMFGIGKMTDAHRRNYYSLVPTGNGIGVAYNF